MELCESPDLRFTREDDDDNEGPDLSRYMQLTDRWLTDDFVVYLCGV